MESKWVCLVVVVVIENEAISVQVVQKKKRVVECKVWWNEG
jgi:hypothetical protein